MSSVTSYISRRLRGRIALQNNLSPRTPASTRQVLMGLALGLAAMSATAYPVTYSFSGEVTDFQYVNTSFHPSAGAPIVGNITYDANYTGTFFGAPWPTPAATLSWDFSVGGENYHQEVISPLVQNISLSGGRISFFDEMPANTSGAAFFDQGGLGFTFTDQFSSLPTELPLADFLSGDFIFSGGSSSADAGSYLRGTIQTMHLIPEPSSAALLAISIVGLMFSRRRHAKN